MADDEHPTQSALLLTEQEWNDLAEMVRPQVLTAAQRRWAVTWEMKRPKWRVARRRSDLAERIIAADSPTQHKEDDDLPAGPLWSWVGMKEEE